MAYLNEEELQNMVQNTFVKENILEELTMGVIQYLTDTIMEKYPKEIARRKVLRMLPKLTSKDFDLLYKDFRERIGQPETDSSDNEEKQDE